MNRPLALLVTASVLTLLLVRCQTTQPLPELVADAGSDAGVSLRIDTAALSNGIPEVPYLERLQASGGVRPLKWTLDQRPAVGFGWLQFDAQGELFGTPRTLETGSLTVSVEDAVGAKDSVSLALSVVTCDEGAQYPCEVGDAGTCELGIQTCSGGTVSGCGSLTASTSVLGCGPGCSACDPLRADHCIDGDTCACGDQGTVCAGANTCCPGDGCADLAADPGHCKTCDNDCFAKAPAHMDAGCGTDDCTFACAKDYQSCDGRLDDGCESNRLTDVSNCGACGTNCLSSPHVTAALCATGQCRVTRCTSGPDGGALYGDCNDAGTDGCETQLTTLANCGACRNACSTNHSATTCTNGNCVLHCDSTHFDCNGLLSDGCERSQDTANCGSCNYDCSAHLGPNATAATCSASGTCQVSACQAGYADCDGDFSNGCETNIANSDPDNCGGCGVLCPYQNQNGTGQECKGATCCEFGCISPGNCYSCNPV